MPSVHGAVLCSKHWPWLASMALDELHKENKSETTTHRVGSYVCIVSHDHLRFSRRLEHCPTKMNQKRFFPRFHFMIYCLFLTSVLSFILFYTLCHSLSALPWPFPSVASMNEQNLLSYLHQVQRPSSWATLTFLRFLIYVCFREMKSHKK